MRTALLAALFFASAACGSATDDGDALPVTGTWDYAATQAVPPLNIHGTLRIDRQDGRFFSGSADLAETDLQGTLRNRTGQLAGSMIGGDAVVEFDLFIDAASRRHVGTLSHGDSMSGTWAYSGTIPPVTGSFRARKIP